MAEISDGNAINTPDVKSNQVHSNFPLSYKSLLTERFGEIAPHFVMEGVESDHLPLRSKHDIRTYTLKAPLQENIQIHKDYFMVPKEAILPFNWEKVYKNPIKGDDVVANKVGHTSSEFGQWLGAYATDVFTALSTNLTLKNTTWGSNNIYAFLGLFFSTMPILESIISYGSLVNVLGCKGPSDLIRYTIAGGNADTPPLEYRFDYIYQQALTEIRKNVKTFTATIDGDVYSVDCRMLNPDPKYPSHILSFREFLELLRDDCRVTISDVVVHSGTATTTDIKKLFADALVESGEGWIFELDLSRFWAYQLVCAHYYTNEQVDYVYNANLFRQYIFDCILAAIPTVNQSFSWNGLTMQYDYLSAYYFDEMFENMDTSVSQTYSSSTGIISAADLAAYQKFCPYFQALFKFNRSLRFNDYFTGLRSNPLAVVGSGISVSDAGGYTSVIDITKGIQAQRFLNAINRGIRRFSETMSGYVKTLFGINQAPDYHNPFWLAHTDDIVYVNEVENTGEAQQTQSVSVNSTLRSNSERYAFEFHPDRRCVILGLTWYDIPRSYMRSTDGQFFEVDRYDMFNPYLQYIGDQPIKTKQLCAFDSSWNPNNNSVFGYQAPYIQYKERFNVASGGFVDGSLPGWAFLADRNARYQDATHVSPNYIRSTPSELDMFYLSLTGMTLSNYFHFIVINENIMDANRPMAFDPQIL